MLSAWLRTYALQQEPLYVRGSVRRGDKEHGWRTYVRRSSGRLHRTDATCVQGAGLVVSAMHACLHHASPSPMLITWYRQLQPAPVQGAAWHGRPARPVEHGTGTCNCASASPWTRFLINLTVEHYFSWTNRLTCSVRAQCAREKKRPAIALTAKACMHCHQYSSKVAMKCNQQNAYSVCS